MPWVQFTLDYNWRPTKTCMVFYRAGKKYLVTTDCATEALKAGAAFGVERPEGKHAGRIVAPSRRLLPTPDE